MAEIHSSAIIEPNVVIGPYVKIGANSHIMANVTIAEHTLIGEEVIVQPGAIIGTEAFYFKRTAEGFFKWRSGGRVILEDRVDVGAGCTINKGVSGDTLIGAGTKLDSQVHIGHASMPDHRQSAILPVPLQHGAGSSHTLCAAASHFPPRGLAPGGLRRRPPEPTQRPPGRRSGAFYRNGPTPRRRSSRTRRSRCSACRSRFPRRPRRTPRSTHSASRSA